jgi:hypothetical protein
MPGASPPADKMPTFVFIYFLQRNVAEGIFTDRTKRIIDEARDGVKEA